MYRDFRARTSPRAPLLILCFSLVHAGLGCGPERQPEEEPKGEILEHRLPACSKYCAAKFECGDHGEHELDFDDEPGCVEACAITTSNMVGFGYQGGDVDACVPEFNAFADCVDALSCDGQALQFGVTDPLLPLPERPCGEALSTALYCSAAHPYRG